MSVVVIILVTDHDVICTIIFAVITIVVIIIAYKKFDKCYQVKIGVGFEAFYIVLRRV